MKNPSIDTFLKRRHPGRPYLILFLIILATFSVLHFRTLSAFEKRLRFIVLNENTLLFSQDTPFEEAGAFQIGQAERAVHLMLNRGPRDTVSPRELQRLLDHSSQKKLQTRIEAETPEFLTKDIRQLVEISGTKIQKQNGRFIEAIVTGQLIRFGNFDGRLTSEVYQLEVWLRLAYNPSLIEGGRYPLIVADFEITPNLITSP